MRPARKRPRPDPVVHAFRAGLLAAAISFSAACHAQPVTLQQGLKGYSDCTAVSLWEPKTKQPADGVKQSVLYVRGTVAYAEKDEKTGKTTRRESGNRVLLRFKLPDSLKGKKLARARLEVFVPEVMNLRMINEILCREVLQAWTAQANWGNAAPGRKWTTPGGTLDTGTDYKNGRPAGAVDSYAFWEYAGQWFPHKYRFLDCPADGRWIDFNITPLVEKWLADPKSNHGVALVPISQRDQRFPNRMFIDIPSPASPNAARRPRLLLDVEPLARPYLVGMTHTLRKYCDKSPRYRFYGPFKESYEMAMARNEFEGFQVMVYPLAGQLKGVTFECGDLLGPGGAKIPAADITYNCQEAVRMHPNGKTTDWYFHGKRFWISDPLSDARPLDLPRHVSTPFWFNVRTRPQTSPGTYKGTITVKPAGAPPRKLKLTVKVWNYKIPEQWNFQTMGQPCWGNYWRAMQPHLEKVAATKGREAARQERGHLHRKYIDFLMDHRFMPTSQYTGNMGPSLSDIPYCVGERGGNTIYLNGNFKLPGLPGERSREIQQLKAALEADKVKLLEEAGKGEQLKKLKKGYEADKAEAGKNRNRAQRADKLREVEAKYHSAKLAMLKAAGKGEQLKALANRYEADRTQLMVKLMKAYEGATERALKSLRGRYDAVVALDGKLRSEGKYAEEERLIDMSLVYIGDETSDWELMRRKSQAIRLACPELMIMIGGSFPRKELDGIIDIYDPQIGGGSGTYSLTEQMVGKIAASQARGERFFWYDAAGPMLPYPNVQCEDPLIASRVVFWMTWKYGVTGFEYYCYGIWSHNLPGRDGKRWPEKPFTPWGWGNTNGDGMLYYPGPEGAFSSVRFENIRDGIEDWESHLVLRDYVEAFVKKFADIERDLPEGHKRLYAKARELLKVPDEIVKDLKTWTWEPQLLLAAHRELGETIDAFSKIVTEKELLAAGRARKLAQLERQRAMLKSRTEAAAKAAAARKGKK